MSGPVGGARRIVRRVLGGRAIRQRSGAPAASSDPFARYRSLDGPRLLDIPTVVHDPALDGDGRLVVLLPHLDLDHMSGGPNTVFQLTARLMPMGIKVRYVATSGRLHPDAAAIADHIERLTGVPVDPATTDCIEADGRRAMLAVGIDDMLLATWWPTAYLAEAALAHVRATQFLYCVQDFEPGFYPWSTKSALAEATYALPMRAIVNEPLLESFLRERRIGRFADADRSMSRTFMPAVDRAVFRPAPERPADAPRRLVFYARPDNPRNLFDLGLRALRVAVARGAFDAEPWEFVSIGRQVPDLELSSRHLLRAEPWLSYQAYGALLGASDILLSPMLSPHTSYPPLEMAAAGGLVVTTTFGPKTADALAAISPAIRGTPPDVDSIADALAAAAAAVTARRAGGEAAPLAATSLPETWDIALADVVPWLADQVRDLRASG